MLWEGSRIGIGCGGPWHFPGVGVLEGADRRTGSLSPRTADGMLPPPQDKAGPQLDKHCPQVSSLVLGTVRTVSTFSWPVLMGGPGQHPGPSSQDLAWQPPPQQQGRCHTKSGFSYLLTQETFSCEL